MAEETAQLSEREREILKLVATGATNQQIANDLGISAHTVKAHMRNIFGKINAASRTEATLYAMRSGLVPLLNGTPTTAEPVAPVVQTSPVVSVDSVPRQAPAAGFFTRYLVSIIGTVAGLVLGVGLIWLFVLRPQFSVPQANVPSGAPVAAIAPGGAMANWLNQHDLPIALMAAGSASIDGQIYVVGGKSATDVLAKVWRYDPVNSAWVALPNKPTAVQDIQAVAIGGKLYVPGGAKADGSISDILEVYDPVAQTWARKANLPYARSGYGLAAVEGKLYLFGGWDGMRAIGETLMYDPATDQWQALTPMPTARAYCVAVAVDGKMYVLGGEDASGALAANEQFTPALNGPGSWAKVIPLQQPRSRFGASAVTNNIIVLGGTGGEAPARYDVRTAIWQDLKPPKLSLGSQPAVVTRDSSVFVVAGDPSKPASAFYELRLLYTVTITLP